MSRFLNGDPTISSRRAFSITERLERLCTQTDLLSIPEASIEANPEQRWLIRFQWSIRHIIDEFPPPSGLSVLPEFYLQAMHAPASIAWRMAVSTLQAIAIQTDSIDRSEVPQSTLRETIDWCKRLTHRVIEISAQEPDRLNQAKSIHSYCLFHLGQLLGDKELVDSALRQAQETVAASPEENHWHNILAVLGTANPDHWTSEKNQRRGHLIEKQVAGKTSEDEERELDQLNADLDEHLDQIAPLRSERLEDLLSRIRHEHGVS